MRMRVFLLLLVLGPLLTVSPAAAGVPFAFCGQSETFFGELDIVGPSLIDQNRYAVVGETSDYCMSPVQLIGAARLDESFLEIDFQLMDSDPQCQGTVGARVNLVTGLGAATLGSTTGRVDAKATFQLGRASCPR